MLEAEQELLWRSAGALVFAIASGLNGDEEYSDSLPYEMIIVAVLKD